MSAKSSYGKWLWHHALFPQVKPFFYGREIPNYGLCHYYNIYIFPIGQNLCADSLHHQGSQKESRDSIFHLWKINTLSCLYLIQRHADKVWILYYHIFPVQGVLCIHQAFKIKIHASTCRQQDVPPICFYWKEAKPVLATEFITCNLDTSSIFLFSKKVLTRPGFCGYLDKFYFS